MKIHGCVDASANPIRLILEAGQLANVAQGAILVKDIPTEAVIANNGYGGNALIAVIEAAWVKPSFLPAATGIFNAKSTDIVVRRATSSRDSMTSRISHAPMFAYWKEALT